MTTELHTFIDIFGKEIECQEDKVALKKIVIPIIQRDYAQGRENPDTNRVRQRFLDSLYEAVTVAPITLDFIYGDIDPSGIMTPLDGQQRLTTLFLLHWYAAKKEAVPEEEYRFLRNFSYETRYSARDFCALLIDFPPSFSRPPSEEIIDQPWFPLEWKKDQTISAMLVMLDAIHGKFSAVENLWQRLKDGAISFYFLLIQNMGLTDALYIKMNSRGKPLTTFEHFKAELERNLRIYDPIISDRLMAKIDRQWTTMLWAYRGDDNLIDDAFLRYFRFICDVLCYKSWNSPQGKSGDEFDLLNEYFSPACPEIERNLWFFENLFDCWCNMDDGSPGNFLERFLSHEHEVGKVKIDSRYDIDILRDCLNNYADIIGGRNRKFPLNRFVVLYSIVVYLTHNLTHKGEVTEDDFVRRLRVINNLAQNSEDEISDSENRTSGNRMPAILQQIESIMLQGTFDVTVNLSFNTFQMEEEKEKLNWCKLNPGQAEDLFTLEDHALLYGQIGIVGTENHDLFERFASLFSCDWDAVDCAILASGPYLQTERNKWRHQMGSYMDTGSAWKALFHRSSNDSNDYENTKSALRKLLKTSAAFSDTELKQIASNYLESCESKKEFDWRYYYIKYPSFRPGRYGKYSWRDYTNKPYEFLTMWTEFSYSSNSRQPFLYEIDPESINKDENGWSLLYGTKYVTCENDAFVVYDVETEEEIGRLPIIQNENGIDVEDRIEKGKALLRLLVQGT